ncbi:NatC N(alpha)-terminal acetyltransferase [Gracilaria domingensis]|nr:NatC N(alpha)-terminal acetyltransferase [Gracilaria domingensis]
MASAHSTDGGEVKRAHNGTTIHPRHNEWKDVTESFEKAKDALQLGEMIHSDGFTLCSAMSAIGLMDPKMDLGCGAVRDAREVQLPRSLTRKQIVNVMDQLMACEMSWLDSHSLPQTVFSCVYAHRLTEIRQLELFTFLRLQLATMDSVISIVEAERVADEEDFITWTHGFQIRPLRSGCDDGDEDILRNIWRDMDETVSATSDSEVDEAKAIALRIKFRVQFHRVIKYLGGLWRYDVWKSSESLLVQLEELVDTWTACPFIHDVDVPLLEFIFDEAINRHLLTSTPPRNQSVFDVSAALVYLQDIVKELKAFVKVRLLALAPHDPAHGSLIANLEPRSSLHVAVHAVQCFASEFKPKALTRSLMARMMLPEHNSSLFGHYYGEFTRLVSTDLGSDWKSEILNAEQRVKLHRGIHNLFKYLCHNQGRQRSNALHEVKWWDRFANACGESKGADQGAEEQDLEGAFQGLNLTKDGLQNQEQNVGKVSSLGGLRSNENAEGGFTNIRSRLQNLSLEITARLMVHHWLLGFECDLYQAYEYSAVYFNIGYVLMTLTNATKTLVSAMNEGTSMHPLRYALFLFDEGCRWICKAFFTALEAFSSSEEYDYSLCDSYSGSTAKAGRKPFGSDELWYDQRFGVFVNLENGPVHTDYESFQSFLKMQEESLREGESETSLTVLRLNEAAASFLTARRKLEHAKKLSQRCAPNALTDQVLRAARVAVENSLVLSRLLASPSESSSTSGNSPVRKVGFNFSKHAHFPVLIITCT